MIVEVAERKERPAEREKQGGDERRVASLAPSPRQDVGSGARPGKMNDEVHRESEIHRQQHQDKRGRVEEQGVRVRKDVLAPVVIRVPVGELALADHRVNEARQGIAEIENVAEERHVGSEHHSPKHAHDDDGNHPDRD